MASSWTEWILDLQNMQPEEVDKLFMQKANEGKNLKFEYIDHLGEYFMLSRYRKALKKVVQNYVNAYWERYDKYCKLVLTYSNKDVDLDMLLTMKACENCVDYYNVDIETLDNMLQEFRAYVFNGHFISTILNNETRSISDYWDHRYYKPEDPTDEQPH